MFRRCLRQLAMMGGAEGCKGISRHYDLRMLANNPGHTWRTLCVRNEDFSNGLWATVLLTEGAEVVEEAGSLIDGYKLVRVCEPIFGWLCDLMRDAKRENSWIELDKGLSALVLSN